MKMTHLHLLAAICIAQGGPAMAETPAAGNSAWLVKDGVAQGHLFLPRTCGRPMLLAAEELREYVRKMTGADLPLAYRGPDVRHRKDVGIQLVVRDEAEWKGREPSQAFAIEETLKPRGAVLLTGVTIRGNTEMAVLYGVYQYLHELGVRWFSPGEIGENVPVLRDLPIRERKDAYSPSFLGRGLSLSGVHKNHFDTTDPKRYRDVIHHEYDLWTLRNRTAFQRYIHTRHWFDFNTVTQSGGHGIRRAALGNADITEEPERFPLVTRGGTTERRAKSAQICFTNEKNVQQAIASAAAFFDRQVQTRGERNTDLDDLMDTCPMGLSDSSGICECDPCDRVAGNPPNNKDRLVWHFMNRVAKGLSAQKPGKKIGLFAPYFELHRPPPDVTIEPNIVAVSCRGVGWSAAPEDQATYPFTRKHAENMLATRKAGAEMRTYDYVMWRGTPQPLNILDAAAAYKRLGFKYYHAEVMSRNEQVWPILWSLSQYLWDSDQDPRQLLADYCNEYYGKAGPLVLDLMTRLDAGSRAIPRLVYGGLRDTHAMVSDALIAHGRKSLNAAIETLEDKEKVRLERFRDTFEMFARTAETYRSYCEALNRRTPKAIAAAKAKFADYETFWEARQLSATCSPGTLAKMQRLGKVEIAPRAEPKARKGLDDEKAWLRELFAFDRVPESIENLFPLPEVWKFTVDYEDKGLREGWQKVELDDGQTWQPISTWNFFESQGYQEIGGRFWYRLRVKAPVFPAGKRIFLRIGSLDDGGDIYINGKLAYSRKHVNPDDWQSSFAFEVTAFIVQGKENVIAVRGYDSFGAGGIWRPCALYTD